eukprot:GILK01003776.1.p1 GENE.GILK01003776.1~~GILK01003776.1.p1  ORF type:complete len:445 (+),score=57.90 GILK01003776.1:43-1377(+)
MEKRKRVHRACLPCHESKVSCGDERPCRRCVVRGLPDHCIEFFGRRGKKPATAMAPVTAPSQMSHVIPLTVTSIQTQTTFPMARPAKSLIFGLLFNCFQDTVAKHQKLPDAAAIQAILQKCSFALSAEQKSVLREHFASFGDSRYRDSLKCTDSTPDMTHRVLEEFRPEDFHLQCRKQPIKPFERSQIEMLPIAAMYSIHDATQATLFFYPNQRFIELFGYTREEVNRYHQQHHFMFIAAVTEPTALPHFLHQMWSNFMANLEQFSISTVIVNKFGIRIPCTVNVSMQADESGAGRVVLICFCPQQPLPRPLLSSQEHNGLDMHALKQEPSLFSPCISSHPSSHFQIDDEEPELLIGSDSPLESIPESMPESMSNSFNAELSLADFESPTPTPPSAPASCAAAVGTVASPLFSGFDLSPLATVETSSCMDDFRWSPGPGWLSFD